MKVAVNGETIGFRENATIHEVLASSAFNEEYVLVLVNGEMMTKDTWGETALKTGDKVEIIRVVGGG